MSSNKRRRGPWLPRGLIGGLNDEAATSHTDQIKAQQLDRLQSLLIKAEDEKATLKQQLATLYEENERLKRHIRKSRVKDPARQSAPGGPVAAPVAAGQENGMAGGSRATQANPAAKPAPVGSAPAAAPGLAFAPAAAPDLDFEESSRSSSSLRSVEAAMLAGRAAAEEAECHLLDELAATFQDDDLANFCYSTLERSAETAAAVTQVSGGARDPGARRRSSLVPLFTVCEAGSPQLRAMPPRRPTASAMGGEPKGELPKPDRRAKCAEAVATVVRRYSAQLPAPPAVPPRGQEGGAGCEGGGNGASGGSGAIGAKLAGGAGGEGEAGEEEGEEDDEEFDEAGAQLAILSRLVQRLISRTHRAQAISQKLQACTTAGCDAAIKPTSSISMGGVALLGGGWLTKGLTRAVLLSWGTLSSQRRAVSAVLSVAAASLLATKALLGGRAAVG